MKLTTMKIKYDSVFEVAKAHRILKNSYSIECDWTGVYGRLKFERTEDQHDFQKGNGIWFELT